MSISQLNDPSMRDALGVDDGGGGGNPTLVYTNSGTSATLQVGEATNTVAISSVPILSYLSPSAVQINPLPINITINPPHPASPLNNVTVAEFHWLKQDPNPLLDQDKKGYFKLGDGVFKIGAEWVGFGPQYVILEGAIVEANIIGNQDGTNGLSLAFGGDSLVSPTTTGLLWMDTTGQLNVAHQLPLSSTGGQSLFRPTSVTAIQGIFDTPVGVTNQIAIPLSGIVSSTAQGGAQHFSLPTPTTLRYDGPNGGTFFVEARVALDTITPSPQLALVHLRKNGVDVPLTASRLSVTPNEQNSVTIIISMVLVSGDTVEVVLSSPDVAMTATNYPPLVGPPISVPAEPAVSITLTRIA